MKTALSMLAGVSMLALAGAANAGEPVTLSDAQMDGVTAGFTAISFSDLGAFAFADLVADAKAIDIQTAQSITTTGTDANGNPTVTYPFARTQVAVQVVGVSETFTSAVGISNAAGNGPLVIASFLLP
jgi:hypothetical protein